MSLMLLGFQRALERRHVGVLAVRGRVVDHAHVGGDRSQRGSTAMAPETRVAMAGDAESRVELLPVADIRIALRHGDVQRARARRLPGCAGEAS